ncbi:MAG: pseudouridine synthase [Nitrospirae bacterium]|jgi:23S rRNA pseudouridine2605 synthase|nr:pseudouridine synthase [Nitrospirota bacterium]
MAREWVREGRLSFEDGRSVDSVERFVEGDAGREPVFLLDGKALFPDPPRVFACNKPRGSLVTRTDPKGRKTVFHSLSFPAGKEPGLEMSRMMPVGRLDQASAGLILLTNRPSALSHLLDPDRDFPREYRVQIRPFLKREDWEKGLSGGMWAKALGFKEVDARIEKENSRTTWLRLGLREGKNREIRRLFDEGGYEVLHLIRVRLGPFELKDLAPGRLVDVSRFFLRGDEIVLDIILDMSRSGDIIEVKEDGAVLSLRKKDAFRKG